MFEDGCWLNHESDDWGENKTREMVYRPRRGDKALTQLSGDEDIDELQVA